MSGIKFQDPTPKHSNLAICYEGIQRVYRNAVVRHIRSSLTKAYPEDYINRLKKPFKEKEWEEIKKSAMERRLTGEISPQIVDDFDLLGVNHFFNLFDTYYEIICESDPSFDQNQNKIQKQMLLQWTKMIKNLRDPLSHPSEEDFSFDDSFMLLEFARRVLLRLQFHEDAERIQKSKNELKRGYGEGKLTIDPLEDRLPPKESIVVDFVGRRMELKALWEWFHDAETKRWALAGEGGKGKSALAYKFATDVKYVAPKHFDFILWLSAKKKMFQEGIVSEIDHPDFTNLDNALSQILFQYGGFEEGDGSVGQKRVRVLELFDTFPALIVVDDIDSLEGEDEDAIEFFTFSVPQTKSKVLLTSRRSLFGLGKTTTYVSGLNQEEAEKFVLSRCQLMGLDPALLKDCKHELIKVTESSPLYIEDLMRLLLIVPPREAIKLWADKGGNEARKYALGRELDLLSDPARHVLIAACIGERALSFPEIESITGFSSDQLRGAIGELQRLFLVPKPRLIEGEQRFSVNVNTRSLVIRLLESSDLYRRVETAHKRTAGEAPKIGRGAIAAIIRQASFHIKNNDYRLAERLLKNALEQYLNHPDLLGFLGFVYKKWNPPRITDAREKFKRASQLKCLNEEMYKQWCRMEIDEREWKRAAEAAAAGIRLIPDSRLLQYFAGYARSRLGKELLMGGHRERAGSELREAVIHLEEALKDPAYIEISERYLNAEIYRALILTFECAEDLRNMTKYFARWRQEYPDDPEAASQWERLSRKFKLI